MSKKSWRRTGEYDDWRDEVIERDGACQVPCCGAVDNLHAHHLNHASYFPGRRFDPFNGITMCGDCHSHYHNDYHRSTRAKCTSYDWENFVSLVEYITGTDHAE